MAWRSIADLMVREGRAEIALLGVPMEAGSVTPGRCDLGPETVRRAARRVSTYDAAREVDLEVTVHDLGDLPVAGISPADGFGSIRDAAAAATAAHQLTILVGGNNAITRPALHGLGVPLAEAGLITLDAHLDMRDTGEGPGNGNPVRCLLEDGLPGRNICQIGIAPFANTAEMHRDAIAAGNHLVMLDDIGWLADAVIAVAGRLEHCAALMVDFDIDVIDRSQCPAAPGARPGGLAATDFFAAARALAAHPKVRLVDLTEFDPSLDVSDIGALVAARWLAEILTGYAKR